MLSQLVWTNSTRSRDRFERGDLSQLVVFSTRKGITFYPHHLVACSAAGFGSQAMELLLGGDWPALYQLLSTQRETLDSITLIARHVMFADAISRSLWREPRWMLPGI